jgi:hypothetical protein
MGALYIGLVHHPVIDRYGQTATTSITGMDLHDIARTAMTYGVERYFMIEPFPSQREIAKRMKRYWLELDEPDDPTHRADALARVRILHDLEESIGLIRDAEDADPWLIGTSARAQPGPLVAYEALRGRIETDPEPVYILFGTGWGLAPELLDRADGVLPPIAGPVPYNHLSVRAAAAVTLDRLRGRRE